LDRVEALEIAGQLSNGQREVVRRFSSDTVDAGNVQHDQLERTTIS
jgi:hypothetical protein